MGSDFENATKQHSLLGNRFLISTYIRTLLDNAFADMHVRMEMTGATMEEVCFLYGPYSDKRIILQVQVSIATTVIYR
jgi:hypothetical protein